jgi:hypothetical protein
MPGPSWREQVVEFWQDLFRSRGPAIEQPPTPWWERARRQLRLLFGGGSSEQVEIWLWIVLGALLVGIAAMFFLWSNLLRSGDLVFR